MVEVAEGDPQLVGEKPLLHPGDQEVGTLLHQKLFQLEGVRVVDDDRPLLDDVADVFVVVSAAGLGSYDHDVHPDLSKSPHQRDGLGGASHVDGGLLSGDPASVPFDLGRDPCRLPCDDLLGPLHHL